MQTAPNPYAIEVEKSDICRAILDCNATRFAKGQVLHVRKDSGNRIVEIKRIAHTLSYSLSLIHL